MRRPSKAHKQNKESMFQLILFSRNLALKTSKKFRPENVNYQIINKKIIYSQTENEVG